MRKTIERLRSKPHHVRKNIALAMSVVITLAIFGVWLSAQPFIVNDDGSIIVDTRQSSSPLSVLNDSVASAFSGIAALFR